MRWVLWLAILVLPAAAKDPEAPGVEGARRKAIDSGVGWLKRKTEYRVSRWGSDDTGPMLFVVYTLSRCGVERNDPIVEKGLKRLRDYWEYAAKSADVTLTRNTYYAASIVLVLTAANAGRPPKRPSRNRTRPPRGSKFDRDEWKILHACVESLTVAAGMGNARSRSGGHTPSLQNRDGGWGYAARERASNLAATHYVLTALRAAARAGYPVEPEVYVKALGYLRKMVKRYHEYAYDLTPDSHGSASLQSMGMIAANICREQLVLAKDKKHKVPEWVGEVTDFIPGFETEFTVDRNISQRPPERQHHYYYLWTVEQLGTLTGKKRFGDVDWYDVGTRYLLEKQQEEGNWVDPTCDAPNDVLGTCFALLFLAHRTVPPKARG